MFTFSELESVKFGLEIGQTVTIKIKRIQYTNNISIHEARYREYYQQHMKQLQNHTHTYSLYT